MASCQGRYRVIQIHSFPALLDWQSISFPSRPNLVRTGATDNSEFLGKLTNLQPLCEAAVAIPLRYLHSTVKKWKPRQSQRGSNSISSAALQTEGKEEASKRRTDVPEGCFALSVESASSQLCLVLEGHSYRQVEAQTLYTTQVSQYF